MRALWLLPLAALPLACSGGPDLADAGPVPVEDAAVDGGALRLDSGVPLDAGHDAGGADGGLDGGAEDGGPRPDAGRLDGGADPVAPCSEVTFRLQRPGATTVWVTGSFTGWAATPQDGAIALAAAGDTFTVTTAIPTAGRHAYKFIVNGATWIDDPANPEREDDTFGGFNSLLSVCPAGVFEVRAHRTLGRDFDAVVAYVGPGDAQTLTATLDHAPLAPGAVVVQDRLLDVHLAELAPGIHDLRLAVDGQVSLLKVYVDESTDWRDALMYFVMTDRFVNGDPSNDAPVGDGITHPLADYLGGDFAGIQQRIEAGYFNELGVNALWITWPLDNTDAAWQGQYRTYDGCTPSGTASTRFSGYHGYWPKSGRDVEPRFGTEQALLQVVDAAHARGIRVLLDFTANHVHQDSPYFQEHPEWFNLPAQLCRDGLWDGDLREECWFDTFLPDWDFDAPAARAQVLDDAVDVAKRLGADGFRVDALKHMEDAFIRELRARAEAELEQTGVTFYLVGETFTGDASLIDRYVGPDMLHGQFDVPSNLAIRRGLAIDEIGLDEMHRAVRSAKAAYGADAPWMSTFVGNHDIARFVSKASGELPCGVWSVEADTSRAHAGGAVAQPSADAPYARLKLAMAYAYALPGVPLLYYGDEVGLAGAGDPDNRRMLPADAALSAQMQGTRQFVRALGRLRAEAEVLRAGAVDVGGLGLAPGATLRAGLGGEDVTVNNGRIMVTVDAQSAQIYVTR